nr:unnamed protein product [Callosobruchus analis]
METTFKCCKKSINNYCCIVCTGIFHQSCAARLKGFTILEGSKVLCSVKCEQTDKDRKANFNSAQKVVKDLRSKLDKALEENEVIEIKFQAEKEDMQQKIDVLQQEKLEIQNQIQRDRRRIRDYEDEVLEVEKGLLEEINRQKNLNFKINKEITELNDLNKQLLEKLEIYERQIEELDNSKEELVELNKDMVGTIKIQENENKILQEDILKMKNCMDKQTTSVVNKEPNIPTVRCQVDLTKDQLVQTQTNTTTTPFTDYSSSMRKPSVSQSIRRKTLILGDESARDCASKVLRKINSSEHNVEGLIKTGIEISELTKDIFYYTQSYGQDDHVIISFKTNNISNHTTMRKFLRNALPIGKTTNLEIMCDISEMRDEPVIKYIKSSILKYIAVNRNSSIGLTAVYKSRGQTIVKCMMSLIEKQNSIRSKAVLKSVSTVCFNSIASAEIDKKVIEINNSFLVENGHDRGLL